jgi:hypothetical protein
LSNFDNFLEGKLEVLSKEECLQSIEVDNFLEQKLEEVSSNEECLQSIGV